jgi:hypothetical protein
MPKENEEWKNLCELVANESDPLKLSKHLDRLIRALDARKQTLRDDAGQVKPTSDPAERND